MNAILVFDPSNDLLLVKSNQQFRSRLLKYARLNGLLAAAGADRHWTPLASLSSSSSECDERGESRRPPTGAQNDRSPSNRAQRKRPAPSKSPSIWAGNTNSSRPAEVSNDVSASGATRARRRTQKRTRQSRAARSKLELGQTADDTSKCYTDILMLLLTPYVASLRLSNDLRGQQSDAYAELRLPPSGAAEQSQPADQRRGASSGRANNAAQQVGGHQAQRAARHHATNNEADEELLAKFMSSISINHECRANEQCAPTAAASDPAALDVGGTRAEWAPIGSSDEERERQRSQRQGFSALQMPVDCLKDCQVVYCQLFDFIFIYMQELASVSSFKLRLLQKRVDLFARLTLLLFGRALNSLRLGAGTSSSARRQTQLLRRAYDCWFANQFQADLFLEANERLIVGSHIGRLCGDTLRKVSAELRARQTAPQQSGPGAESHQHALLFSGSKLVARFSCFNANPLTHEDLILLLVLLKAFNADHNNELPSAPDDQQEADHERAARSARLSLSRCHYKSHYHADRHTSQIRAPSAAPAPRGGRRRVCSGEERGAEMPHQLAVFLATSEPSSPDAQVYVPHMLRFVVLARGVTLCLISEISSAYLNGQLSRVHSLLLDFNRHSLAESDRAGAGLDDHAPGESRRHQRHSRRQLRLSQVARLTDCISAIKSYFFAPRLAGLLGHSAPSGRPNQIGRSGEPANAPSLLTSLFGRRFSQPQTAPAADGQRDCATPEPNHLDDSERIADGESDCDKPAESEPTQGGRQQAWRMADRLGPAEQRLCRHLLRKLAELAQNNVQTYMRQTFGMALDEHKREALLSSVSATVRQSFSELVLEPQLARLAGQSARDHDYLRELGDQHDRIKLLAKRGLNDYLDYLAVKAQCNLTLGAPLTHDLSSITGFIYVDRARQELLISPMSRTHCAPMSWPELVEGDFEASIERQRRREAARMSSLDEHDGGHSSDISTDEQQDIDSSDELEQDERAEEADESESSDAHETEEQVSQDCLSRQAECSEPTSSDSIESIIYTGQQPIHEPDHSDRRQLWTRAPLETGASLNAHRQRPYFGTSQDISAAGSSSASSQQSMQMLASDHSTGAFFGQRSASSDRHLDRAHLMARLEATCSSEQQRERRLGGANEQLVQAFSAFIYNRLAAGQTSSFSQNCGHSQLSYFMWLKRQTDDKVIKLEPDRRQQTSRLLAANFRSLPTVTCDNFFARLANCLVGNSFAHSFGSLNSSRTSSYSSLWSSQRSIGGSSSAGSSSSAQKRRVKVFCQLRELHPKTGRQICKRQLTRVREEDESADGADEEADEAIEFDIASSSSPDFNNTLIRSKSMANMEEERDFTSFMRKQRSRQTPKKGFREARHTSADVAREVSCHELICVHDRSLLVQRNQATFEAQRLAIRLANLIRSNAHD